MTKTVKLHSKPKSRTSVGTHKGTLGTRTKLSSTERKRQEGVRKIAKVALILTAVVLIGILGGTIYAFSWLQGLNQNLPTVDSVFPEAPISSILYDRNGIQLFKAIGDVNSDPVDIDQIPERVKWPFLAGEDEDFYNHDGFDTAAILRCGFSIAASGGSNLCGGSTITQQLIKITALQDVPKVERKIQELFMATRVEQANSKDEILQMYLTVTWYGSNIVGIQSASKFYFNKEAKDLTLAEAAILASIVNIPSYLSPTKPYDGDTETAQARVKQRQLYVLDQLRDNMNMINEQILINAEARAKEKGEEFNPETVELFTEEMIAAAEAQELVYQPPIATDMKAGHFVNFVLRELQTRNYKNGEEPFTEEELHNGGYRIYTTIDYELQKTAEAYAEKAGNQYSYWNIHNAAVMTITPSNGQIITMAGSKGFYGESEGCDENGANCWYNPEVNILATLQSPGSTNKALAYYLGYDMGLSYPGDILPDIPISLNGYNPKNWDSLYKGVENTAREMLRQSRNLPALIMIEAVGVQKYIEAAREFGYSTYEDASQFGHSVVLGGTTVYPYEHAAAFGVFANQGTYVTPESILRIEDSKGNVLYETAPEQKTVASSQGTYLLNQSLYNLENISWDGRDIAAKTGTSEENIDSLMVMYSPDFVTLGWVGNNNNDPTNPYNGFASLVVKPWLVEYMTEIGNASYFANKTSFPRPGYVYRGGGTCNSEGQCIGLSADWMIEGKKYNSYITKKTAQVCSDQPDKLARDVDIALGFAVTKEFKNVRLTASAWQGFLDNYMKEKGMNGGIPTAYCTVDRGTDASGPIIRYNSIEAPDRNTLNVDMNIIAVGQDVESVEIYLSNKLVTTVTNGFPSINGSYSIESLTLSPGSSYTVRIVAEDEGGETSEFVDQIIIGEGSSAETGTLGFVYVPPTNLTYGVTAGPEAVYTISVQYVGNENISSVQLYQTNTTIGETIQLGSMSDQGAGVYHYAGWGQNISVSNAVYTFYATAVTQDGAVIQTPVSQSVEVRVQ